MKTNSLLTRHEKEAAAVQAVAATLIQWGHEVKVSFAENKIILATTAMPRTLRKARTQTPNDMNNFIAMLAASVKEKTK